MTAEPRDDGRRAGPLMTTTGMPNDGVTNGVRPACSTDWTRVSAMAAVLAVGMLGGVTCVAQAATAGTFRDTPSVPPPAVADPVAPHLSPAAVVPAPASPPPVSARSTIPVPAALAPRPVKRAEATPAVSPVTRSAPARPVWREQQDSKKANHGQSAPHRYDAEAEGHRDVFRHHGHDRYSGHHHNSDNCDQDDYDPDNG
jgi:hypothetical protein